MQQRVKRSVVLNKEEVAAPESSERQRGGVPGMRLSEPFTSEHLVTGVRSTLALSARVSVADAAFFSLGAAATPESELRVVDPEKLLIRQLIVMNYSLLLLLIEHLLLLSSKYPNSLKTLVM